MELIKTWRKSGFTLRLWDTYRTDRLGKCILRYEFKDGRKVIFEGSNFACSPLNAIDSLECVYSLLGFLSLKHGDTDSEYFDSYTPEQLEWRDSSRRDALRYIVCDFEYRKENSK